MEICTVLGLLQWCVEPIKPNPGSEGKGAWLISDVDQGCSPWALALHGRNNFFFSICFTLIYFVFLRLGVQLGCFKPYQKTNNQQKLKLFLKRLGDKLSCKCSLMNKYISLEIWVNPQFYFNTKEFTGILIFSCCMTLYIITAKLMGKNSTHLLSHSF